LEFRKEKANVRVLTANSLAQVRKVDSRKETVTDKIKTDKLFQALRNLENYDNIRKVTELLR